MDSLHPIDLRFGAREHAIGVYLVETDEGLALFDCGPTSTRPRSRPGSQARRRPRRHPALLLSHIHLDHAGAAGPLVRDHPELTVWVSEIGRPHLVDPSRLERSARRLYGDMFDPLWGELAPVPEENVRLADGDVLGWEAFPAQGHASHHVCYLHDGTLLGGRRPGVRMPGAIVCPPRLASARRRRRGLARDDRRDPRALAGAPRPDPLRRPRRRRPRISTGSTPSSTVGPPASATGWIRRSSSRRRSPTPAPTPIGYDRVAPLWQSWHGLNRYWEIQTA